MVTLPTLLDRVRKADGPDERLGADLAKLFMSRDDYPAIATLCMFATSAGVEAIGAALALVEQVLPGWQMERRMSGGNWFVQLLGPEFWKYEFMGSNNRHQSTAFPTHNQDGDPLAILAALLSALIARQEPDNG